MSDECTLDDDEDERPWDEVIREASARFSAALNAMFGPPQCRKAEMTKLRRQAAGARYRARKKAARTETPEQYRERRSAVAAAREEKARAKRGNTCARGHAITPETAITRGERTYPCSVCFYAWQERINDNRRRAYALLAVAA